MRYEEYLRTISEEFADKSLIKPEDFPDMELYSDQVSGFLNDKLKIYIGEDSEKGEVITKTMISNYVKHGMLPATNKKKYSRDHMILIAFIFYLKSTFQMSEIERLLKPFIENYDSAFEENIDFSKLYETLSPLMKMQRENLSMEIEADIERVKDAVRENGIDDDDRTELLLLIMTLALKADQAKYTASKLLDEYFSKPAKGSKK